MSRGTLSIAMLAALVGGFSQAGAQDLRRLPARNDVRITPRLGESVPLDLTFQDEAGAAVRLGDLLRGKPVVLTPIYYECPMLCGFELNGLIRCLRAMEWNAGTEFDVVTFSFDSKEDHRLSAQKKKTSLHAYGREETDAGWRFLTGSQASIDGLCQSIGFPTVYDAKTGQYAHAAGLIVLTPDGRVARYLYGVEFAPRELRLALVEASRGEIGTVSDQVQLLCYAYDPATGKYGLAVFRLLQFCGVGTVLALAGGISWMLWRERHPRTWSLASSPAGEAE